MKKIIVILASFFVLLTSSKAISASSYVVMDMDSNNVLLGSNINESMLIASTSKIMTSIIALENGNLEDIIEVDKSILKAVGSSLYLEIGEKITLKDLIYGLMLRSGNDAGVLIANYISKSMEDFANLMNDYAQKIGMRNTFFYNSHGLENEEGKGNTSSSYDMALLTSYAMKNKDFKKIFKTKNYVAKTDKKTYSWQNKNKLLKYDYITGGKTGFTQKARRTLVTTGLIDKMNIVIVTLKDANDWIDHVALYEKVKNEYSKVEILNKDSFELIDKTISLEDTFYIKNNYSIVVKNEDIKNIKIKYYLENKDSYYDNKVVGVAKIYLKDLLLHSEPVYISVKENISFFEKLVLYFKRLF